MLYPPAFLAAQLDLVSVVAFSPTICSYAEPSNAHSPFKHTHRTHLFSLALQFTDAKPKAPGRFFFFFSLSKSSSSISSHYTQGWSSFENIPHVWLPKWVFVKTCARPLLSQAGVSCVFWERSCCGQPPAAFLSIFEAAPAGKRGAPV